MSGDKTPALGEKLNDFGTALAKGVFGAIPVVGPIVSEVIGLIIPNQRIERIERFIVLLSERLQKFEADDLRKKFDDPEVVDLFEEGIVQSARAISEERKIYIAQLVEQGISGDQKERLEARRLLDLLEAIDDDQIVILASYLRKNARNEEFRQKHAEILDPVTSNLSSSQEEVDAEAMHKLAHIQLDTLGLLQAEFREPRKGELPEFDRKTGMMKAIGHDLTPLGRLLLVRIGLAEPGEF